MAVKKVNSYDEGWTKGAHCGCRPCRCRTLAAVAAPRGAVLPFSLAASARVGIKVGSQPRLCGCCQCRHW